MMPKLSTTIRTGWTLGLRNIRIQILNHALGYAWTLIIPILYALCYIVIKKEISGGGNLQSVDAGWDILRAFLGITLFQYWMQVLQDTSEMIRYNRSMLKGLDIGPAPFVLAIMFEGVISLGIRVLMILAAFPLLKLSLPDIPVAWVLFLTSLVTLHLSAAAIGVALAPWAALYGDVRKALRSITLPIILVSPVFYAAVERTDSFLYWVNIINPLASALAVIHDALHADAVPFYLLPMLAWGMVSILLLTWSLAQLRRQVPILLERLGN